MIVGQLTGTCTGRTLYDLWNGKITAGAICTALGGHADGAADRGIVIATVCNRPGKRMDALVKAGFKSVGTYAGVHGSIAVMIKGLRASARTSKG